MPCRSVQSLSLSPMHHRAGATKGSQLAQPHGQAYLILYSLLFLAARTATWWSARALCSSAPPACSPGGSASSAASGKLGAPGSAAVGGGEQQQEPCLPAELLPLVQGAWLAKLPSSGGGLDRSDSTISSLPSAGCLQANGLGWAASVWPLRLCAGPAPASAAEGKQRFFQLSQDGACLRWSWHKWVLMPHVETLECW